MNYKEAGVNIIAGEQLVQNINSLTKSAHNPKVLNDLKGFAALFELDTAAYTNPVLVSGTDGVGTKILIAHAVQNYETIGIDLVAMCVNDILVHGAKPLFFLDYFATGKLDINIATKTLKSIVKGCEMAGIPLVGGETAEMPGLYNKQDFDLAGFAVGVVEKSEILPRSSIDEGDIIVGLKSSGLHSNGFSLVRHVFNTLNINYTDISPWNDEVWSNILLTPTRIYVDTLLPVLPLIKGLAHITGGGLLNNIPRILPKGLTFTLQYKFENWPPIFNWLHTVGKISAPEMLQTFNCGIGMALIISKKDLETLSLQLREDLVFLGTLEKQ